MFRRLSTTALFVASSLVVPCVVADEVRYYEKDGLTYCETRRTVEEKVPEVAWQDATRTVYRPQYTTETRDVVRTTLTPVTEYTLQPYWVNRWNPFTEPSLAYQYVPRTRWEARSEVVKTPMQCCRMVPDTQSVRTPVTQWKTVQREYTTRVAVGPSSTPKVGSQQETSVARRDQIGGISRLDKSGPPPLQFPSQADSTTR